MAVNDNELNIDYYPNVYDGACISNYGTVCKSDNKTPTWISSSGGSQYTTIQGGGSGRGKRAENIYNIYYADYDVSDYTATIKVDRPAFTMNADFDKWLKSWYGETKNEYEVELI